MLDNTKHYTTNLYVTGQEELLEMAIVLNNLFSVDLVFNSVRRLCGFLFTPFV